MSEHTFWGHVEVLRWVIVRCVAVVSLSAIVLFCLKDFMFRQIVFAPCSDDFLTYRLMCQLASLTGLNSLCIAPSNVELININLSSQLLTHISTSFLLALVLAVPYIISELWFFLSPALYKNERRPALMAAVAFIFQFYLGLIIAYYIIFPLTYNFLSTYQVSETVVNQISLNSYISTFTGLMLTMGLMFEMPVVAYFFARIGLLNSALMKRYRKIAIVVAITLAALITPSTDAFTMLLVAMPLYILYEVSHWVTSKTEQKQTHG